MYKSPEQNLLENYQCISSRHKDTDTACKEEAGGGRRRQKTKKESITGATGGIHAE